MELINKRTYILYREGLRNVGQSMFDCNWTSVNDGLYRIELEGPINKTFFVPIKENDVLEIYEYKSVAVLTEEERLAHYKKMERTIFDFIADLRNQAKKK